MLSGSVQVAAQKLFSSSADQMHNLGETVFSNDGRAFRYAKAGATSLVPGKLQQSAAEVTGDQNLTAVAAAIGDLVIASTSTVTVTANQYAGGLAMITVTPGLGYAYKISGHAAYTAAAPSFSLVADNPVNIALTTSSRIDLVSNPYSAVIVNPATASSTPVGVANFPITNAQFGWLQVAGVACVLADGTVTVGTAVDASNGTAGAVEAHPEAGVQAPVGIAVTGIATTEYGAVKIDLL